MLRSLIAAASQVVGDCYECQDSVEELLDRAEQQGLEVASVGWHTPGGGMRLLQQAVPLQFHHDVANRRRTKRLAQLAANEL
jgi:replicative DNA helicase